MNGDFWILPDPSNIYHRPKASGRKSLLFSRYFGVSLGREVRELRADPLPHWVHPEFRVRFPAGMFRYIFLLTCGLGHSLFLDISGYQVAPGSLKVILLGFSLKIAQGELNDLSACRNPGARGAKHPSTTHVGS